MPTFPLRSCHPPLLRSHPSLLRCCGGLLRPCVACRLSNVVFEDLRLYLVFEFLDMDLKKYMDRTAGSLSKHLVKVRGWARCVALLRRIAAHDNAAATVGCWCVSMFSRTSTSFYEASHSATRTASCTVT